MAGFQLRSSGNHLEIWLLCQQLIPLVPKADSDLGSKETEVHDPTTASCILKWDLS